MRPGGSSSPMIAAPVSDLPAPDSPTTPSTSPGAIANETPFTAVSTPRRVGNSTRRSRTSRSGCPSTVLFASAARPRSGLTFARLTLAFAATAPALRARCPRCGETEPDDRAADNACRSRPQPRVERVTQPVAEQVDREHHDDERDAGEQRHPPFAGEQEVVADANQRAERRLRRRDANAE